jgi:hypothetical protein
LQLRGVDTMGEFIKRQQAAMAMAATSLALVA